MPEQSVRPRREEAYQTVLDLILKGTLREDSRIVESTLCDELGVSRTPMREALFRLEQEGLVKQDLARGFSVMPMNAREVREIYPIIWTLEVLAIKSAERAFNIDGLKALNRSLQKCTSPDKQHEIDDQWHDQLIAGCKNRRLHKEIAALKQSAYRYELAYMRYCNKINTSIEHHKEVLDAIENDEIKNATKLLEQHWRFGMKTLLDWLDWRGD
jgi:DNA-binding GntR family transcriptional regulator